MKDTGGGWRKGGRERGKESRVDSIFLLGELSIHQAINGRPLIKQIPSLYTILWPGVRRLGDVVIKLLQLFFVQTVIERIFIFID